MKKNYKIILSSFLMMLCLWVWYVGSENVNVLSISTWTVYTWKYYCPIDVSVIANYNWVWFGNCQYWLQFDSSNISLNYVQRWSNFTKTDKNYFTWLNNNILYIDEKNEQQIVNETSVCSTIRLQTTTANITSSQIQFVDREGNIPTLNTYLNTNEWLNLANNGEDTLTWVENLTVNFYACPCQLDNKAPIITSWSHGFTSADHYTWEQTISFVTYDKWGVSWPYWTHWQYIWWLLLSGTLGQYYDSQSVPSWMDNQEWVSAKHIFVKIIDESGNVSTINHHFVPYSGTSSIPQYTWDGNYRWYKVSFDTDSFGVEKPVTVVVSVSDNVLSIWWECETSRHTTVFTGVFNPKEAPKIKFLAPQWENINPNAWVEVLVWDTWAWVDTGSVVIEILPVMSWWQMIMSGSIYSWTDLNFQLTGGSEELWWASKYVVSFQPKYEFAVNSQIRLSWYAMDLVWMEVSETHNFTTRADCTFYGCVNFVDIFSGSINISNLIQWQFTGSLIVVTGTVLPYPYLTWASGDVVMCGPLDESINLDWNIDIYSEWQIINWQLYQDEDLYVTGLDFAYESGVITPIY